MQIQKTIRLPLHDKTYLLLTPNQDHFARLIALNYEGAAAYREAYSSDTRAAPQRAWELKNHPKIIKAVAYYRDQNKVKLDISDDRILAEYAALAFSNMANYAEIQTPQQLRDLAQQDQRAVKSIKVRTTTRTYKDESETTTTTEIVLHDKLAALDRIAEVNGIIGKDKGAGQENRPINIIINTASKG